MLDTYLAKVVIVAFFVVYVGRSIKSKWVRAQDTAIISPINVCIVNIHTHTFKRKPGIALCVHRTRPRCLWSVQWCGSWCYSCWCFCLVLLNTVVDVFGVFRLFLLRFCLFRVLFLLYRKISEKMNWIIILKNKVVSKNEVTAIKVEKLNRKNVQIARTQ